MRWTQGRPNDAADSPRPALAPRLEEGEDSGVRPEPSPTRFDVVVLGGALGGASTALLLLRGNPTLRIAIVEKSAAFGRRVGEATVEISAFFLSKVLHLTQHLNECHLSKQGMRFWFANDSTRTLADCSEIGGRYMARMPAWQVDRSVLDEEVLRRAVAAGATLFRPAKVRRVELQPGGQQRVFIESDAGPAELSARWVVDATGFTALLARQEGWYRRNELHPTTAVWTRWRGVRDLDGESIARRFPEWSHRCLGVRATATNHLMGDGWWAWVIPLKGGDYSIGTVFDHRRVWLPDGPSIASRLREFLVRHPVGAELLADASPVESDSHWRTHLPYWSERQSGDGFVLVGDAAGFLDPFYSPGMDWLTYSVSAAVDLIHRTGQGEALAPRLEAHNRDFRRAYDRWFRALYLDKYDVMGDFELMRLCFTLDIGLYYLGVVSQPVNLGPGALKMPVFASPQSELPYRFIATYSRRLARLGRERRRRGILGRANTGKRHLVNGFLPERSTGSIVFKAVMAWLRLELTEGWRTWFRTEPAAGDGRPSPDTVAGQAPRVA